MPPSSSSALEEGFRKTRLGGRVPESEAGRKGPGKRGLAEGFRKSKFGERMPENEAWKKGAGKQGWEEGCRKASIGVCDWLRPTHKENTTLLLSSSPSTAVPSHVHALVIGLKVAGYSTRDQRNNTAVINCSTEVKNPHSTTNRHVSRSMISPRVCGIDTPDESLSGCC